MVELAILYYIFLLFIGWFGRFGLQLSFREMQFAILSEQLNVIGFSNGSTNVGCWQFDVGAFYNLVCLHVLIINSKRKKKRN